MTQPSSSHDDAFRDVGSLSVIGLGYIGLPTAAMFASAGVSVIGVDRDPKVVDAVNSGKAHIEEGNLDALVAQVVASRLLRAESRPSAADAFIIAVPTPLLDGAEPKPDLAYIEAAGRSVAPVLKKGDLIILESTSPVGTTAMLSRLLSAERPDLTFPHGGEARPDICLAYCPERVIPGRMLEELVENDRIVGGMTPRCAHRAAALYKSFVKGECLLTDDRTAEMVKLTENAFRDANIAFANELSMICDDLDVDVWDVIDFANRHPRVSILKPGPGVGGHCIAIDPWFIVAGAPEKARLIRTAREVNLVKTEHILARIEAVLATNPGARVACLGLTYKPDIDDFRESPALEIARTLSKRHPGRVVCCDPYVKALPRAADAGIELAEMDEAIATADVVVLLVAHTRFRSLPRPQGPVVIDTVGFWRSGGT